MPNVYVVDTNTVISALFWPDSLPARACRKAQEGNVVVSQAIIDEWRLVVQRPKFDRLKPLALRLSVLEAFIDRCALITVNQIIAVCRDPKDDIFLALAMEANATLIISGDKDLLTLNPFNGIPIMTAREFLDMV